MAAKPKEYFDIKTANQNGSYNISADSIAPDIFKSKFRNLTIVEKSFPSALADSGRPLAGRDPRGPGLVRAAVHVAAVPVELPAALADLQQRHALAHTADGDGGAVAFRLCRRDGDRRLQQHPPHARRRAAGAGAAGRGTAVGHHRLPIQRGGAARQGSDRKSTRLKSS